MSGAALGSALRLCLLPFGLTLGSTRIPQLLTFGAHLGTLFLQAAYTLLGSTGLVGRLPVASRLAVCVSCALPGVGGRCGAGLVRGLGLPRRCRGLC